MRKRLIALFILAFIYIFPGQIYAATGDGEIGYINDEYGVLTEVQIEELAANAKALYETNGVDFVTILTSRFAGNDAHKYATDLFNSIGIGDATLNNGLLLFIAYDSGDVELVTGDGMKSTITNGTAGQLIDKHFLPKARSAPDEAVMELHAAIVDKAYGYYEGISNSASNYPNQGNKTLHSILAVILGIASLIIVPLVVLFFHFALVMLFGGYRSRRYSHSHGPRHRHRHHHHHHDHGYDSGSPAQSAGNISGGHSSGSGASRSFGSSSSSRSSSRSSRSGSSSRSRSSGGRSSGGGGGRKF